MGQIFVAFSEYLNFNTREQNGSKLQFLYIIFSSENKEELLINLVVQVVNTP